MPTKKTKDTVPEIVVTTGDSLAPEVVKPVKKRKKVKIPFGVVDENGIYRGGPDAKRLRQINSDYPYDDDWIYERQEDGSFRRMWFRGLH